jgi:hypothetical protein
VPKARLAVGVVIAALVAVIVVLLLRGGSSEGNNDGSVTSPLAPRGPVAMNLGGLRSIAESVGHPVYWAGQRPGGYELTVNASGDIYIRYLEGRIPVGSRRQTSLTVATYPYPDAYRTLQSVSRRPGEAFVRTPDGGLVVADVGSPHNVHIAYPGQDIQIEVYDPHAGRALALATAGAITQLQ